MTWLPHIWVLHPVPRASKQNKKQINQGTLTRVSDSHPFHADPDPEFENFSDADPDPGFEKFAKPDPDPGMGFIKNLCLCMSKKQK